MVTISIDLFFNCLEFALDKIYCIRVFFWYDSILSSEIACSILFL